MSGRIESVFEGRKGPLLSVFYTAGYPERDETVPLAERLQASGADMLEIGIPFSDPIADGPVIQESSSAAIQNGMNLDLLLEHLSTLRERVEIPVLLMGYLNPVLQYGMERFLARAASVGVDGLILPDLPVRDFSEKYREMFEQHALRNVFLVTPQTSEERLRTLDDLSSGFLYVVSTPSITGSALAVEEKQDSYFQRLASMKLQNPLVVGFGVSDRGSFERVTRHCDGAIIGSAFLRWIKEQGTSQESVEKFVSQIRGEER